MDNEKTYHPTEGLESSWRVEAGLRDPEPMKYYAGVQVVDGMWRTGPYNSPTAAYTAQRTMQRIAWRIDD